RAQRLPRSGFAEVQESVSLEHGPSLPGPTDIDRSRAGSRQALQPSHAPPAMMTANHSTTAETGSSRTAYGRVENHRSASTRWISQTTSSGGTAHHGVTMPETT